MNNAIAIIAITCLGLLGGLLLVAAGHFFQVEEDVRNGKIQSILPSANCGACGFAGCASYAAAIVENSAPTNLCIPGGEVCSAEIASIMGISAEAVKKQKAIVACQGTTAHRNRQYIYEGAKTCDACATLYNGDSTCPYGCLGYGDCMVSCKFNAIQIIDGIAKINLEKCTGCGVCATVCPKKVIWVREESTQPVVMCANHERGALTKAACTAGCIGCKKCERTCEYDAIHVNQNVARIDLEKCTGCQKCAPICPVGAISVLEKI